MIKIVKALRVRDAEGNFMPLVAIKGEKGDKGNAQIATGSYIGNGGAVNQISLDFEPKFLIIERYEKNYSNDLTAFYSCPERFTWCSFSPNNIFRHKYESFTGWTNLVGINVSVSNNTLSLTRVEYSSQFKTLQEITAEDMNEINAGETFNDDGVQYHWIAIG